MPDFDVEFAVQAKVIDDAAPAVAQHALAVGVIHHREHPVLFRDLVDFIQRRDVAVHREDAVGDDEAAPVLRQVLLDFRFQVGGIAVLVDDDLGAAQARAVDDAGVVEAVGEDDILAPDQWGEGGLVGDEAALDVERILDIFEFCDGPFEFLVDGERSGDGAHRRRPGTEAVDGGFGGVFQAVVVGQAEIVVGAEVEHFFVVYGHPRAGWRVDGAQVDEEAAVAQGVDFFFDPE